MFSSMPLFDVSNAGRFKTRRESSYDRAGGNVDWRPVLPGERLTLMDADGPGIVTHLWFAVGCNDYNYLRYVSIKAWWDGADQPSIDCPIGDFFGVGHAAANKYDSFLMNMVRGEGRRGEATGMNCYVPMPFDRHARIEVFNESPAAFFICYYQVDWVQTDRQAVAGAGRLHAMWRRDNPTGRTVQTHPIGAWTQGRFDANLTGKDNYLVADIRGQGRFLGMNLSIDNIDHTIDGVTLQGFGEGDEMIFIDGEAWPPALHGTGCEDYFCDAWGMTGKSGLYCGVSLPDRNFGGKGWRGTCYRFHVHDPVYFGQSLKFTFEHGHNNCQTNDFSSTAYWYQSEAVGVNPLPPIAVRRPLRGEGEPAREDEDRVVRLLSEVVNPYQCETFVHGRLDQVQAMSEGVLADVLMIVNVARDDFMAGRIKVRDVEARLAPYREAVQSLLRR